MGNCWGSNVNEVHDVSNLMDELELKLSKIVGLDELKLQLRHYAKGMLMDDKRRAMGIHPPSTKIMPHMVFLGNPGTGKTTVARILGDVLFSVGVLPINKLIEVQRSDLVGEFIGQTETKTKAKIEEATGGVLFVDEAYRLALEHGATRDYGRQALDEIMSVMENGNILVIFAGYTEPMERVVAANEGFTRRVTHYFHFEDYSCRELADMLMIKMTNQHKESRLYGFKLDPSCTLEAVQALIQDNSTEILRSKLNGGLVDHMLNNAIQHLNWRLPYDSVGDVLFTITLQDLEDGVQTLAKRVKVY